ncbi:hypothetical protein BT63DRAFT_481686 [Microthyrium microscopicum]|uniref:Uncharacterized protein n=1 Tax=Microthyrium microscopicum TaxID=703497 RepID=A0A6A6U0K9_9PEZI|nr:hypothetical protein BT63DRAFT_481686 [Microthyrium microscopicum]
MSLIAPSKGALPDPKRLAQVLQQAISDKYHVEVKIKKGAYGSSNSTCTSEDEFDKRLTELKTWRSQMARMVNDADKEIALLCSQRDRGHATKTAPEINLLRLKALISKTATELTRALPLSPLSMRGDYQRLISEGLSQVTEPPVIHVTAPNITTVTEPNGHSIRLPGGGDGWRPEAKSRQTSASSQVASIVSREAPNPPIQGDTAREGHSAGSISLPYREREPEAQHDCSDRIRCPWTRQLARSSRVGHRVIGEPRVLKSHSRPAHGASGRSSLITQRPLLSYSDYEELSSPQTGNTGFPKGNNLSAAVSQLIDEVRVMKKSAGVFIKAEPMDN